MNDTKLLKKEISVDDVDKLYERIATTRYSRIRTEERINRKSKIVLLLNIWLSCCIIVSSFIGIVVQQDFFKDLFSNTALIMSILLLGFIVYYSCQHYSERAFKMRLNYTELEGLEFNIRENYNISPEDYFKIKTRYIELLTENENHSIFDYFNAANMRSLTKNNDYEKSYKPKSKDEELDEVLRYTKVMKHKRFWGWLWRVTFVMFLIVVPFILLIIYYLLGVSIIC